MYNDYVTENFNIQDLLTHRSGLGLGAGDLMFNNLTNKKQRTAMTIDKVFGGFTNVLHILYKVFTIKKLQDS